MLRFGLGRRIGRFGAQVPRQIDLDFTAASLPSRATLTRASSGTRHNSSGTLVTETTDVARFDYDPVSLAIRGLLFEPQRQNALAQSAALDNAAWGVTASVIAADAAAAPDGATAAESYTPNAGTGARQIFQSSLTVPTTSAISIFAKRVNGRYLTISVGVSGAYAAATFDLQAGTVTQTLNITWAVLGTAIRDVGNGWYRCTLRASGGGSNQFVLFSFSDVGTFSSTGFGRNNSAVGTGTVAYHLWGAQMEDIGSGVPAETAYVATTTPTTRAADALTLAVPSGTYSRTTRCGTLATAGTAYADQITVTGGSYNFALPAAAVAAGERHIRSVALTRVG